VTGISGRVKAVGLALGFDRVGIAAAGETPGAERLQRFVAEGFAGEMDYVPRRLEERLDPRRLLPGARSVVAVALAMPRAAGEPPTADGTAHARVARYARGDDYHEVLGERLRALASALEPLAGRPVASRTYVDTGPVQERAWAARAGLGWVGKNGCLIDRELGSHLFLGVLLTDLPLDADAPESDHCGTCRACLDACPTDAFPEPGLLDATRCLAYTTIELRGAIAEPLREAQGDWVFGCDVCQDVCPWNREPRSAPPADPMGLRERLAAKPAWREPALAWLTALRPEDWRVATRRSALRRAPYRQLLRNALVAAGHSGDASLVDAVRAHAGGADPLLAEHARWALAQLGQARAEPAGSS
jgi:epoxyqueuosine reductase